MIAACFVELKEGNTGKCKGLSGELRRLCCWCLHDSTMLYRRMGDIFFCSEWTLLFMSNVCCFLLYVSLHWGTAVKNHGFNLPILEISRLWPVGATEKNFHLNVLGSMTTLTCFAVLVCKFEEQCWTVHFIKHNSIVSINGQFLKNKLTS